jgi:oligopeptidase A
MPDLDVRARLLDPAVPPPFAELRPEAILDALDAAIAAQSVAIDLIVAEQSVSFDRVWMPLEHTDGALDALRSVVSHSRAVGDTPELRAACIEDQCRLVDLAMCTGQNRR